MKRLVLLGVLMTAVAASGCADIQQLSISARNRSAAYSAWKAARWDYWQQGVPYRVREHIGRGFQQGYYDVAEGGTGKLPLFPPNYYWGVQFQNAEGNELVAAWFRGYQDGAMAAERDGIGGFNQLPSSYSGVGPMPGTTGSGPTAGVSPSYNPNQPSGPYDEPLPPPPSGPLTPVPPNVNPNAVIPPAMQEEVPLKTLDAPEFPAPPKAVPAPPPPAPGATLPAIPTPSAAPMPKSQAAPNTVPVPPAPAAPKASPTPTGPAPKVGLQESLDPIPTGIDFEASSSIERASSTRIRAAARRGADAVEISPAGHATISDMPENDLPADRPSAADGSVESNSTGPSMSTGPSSPYAQRTLFAEPAP